MIEPASSTGPVDLNPPSHGKGAAIELRDPDGDIVHRMSHDEEPSDPVCIVIEYDDESRPDQVMAGPYPNEAAAEHAIHTDLRDQLLASGADGWYLAPANTITNGPH